MENLSEWKVGDDLAACKSLASKLNNAGEQIIKPIADELKKSAESVLEIEDTVTLNKQMNEALLYIVGNLQKLAEPLAQMGKCADAIIASAEKFEASAANGALGRV